MMTAETTLCKTPLYADHQRRGAKMVPFAGWTMPLQFGKVLEEHHAVRQAAGLFDISHMGLLSLYSGRVQDTMLALDRLVPQDLTVLSPGKAVYTQLLNPEGGIIDDIIVYAVPPLKAFPELSEWLIICNAANTGRVRTWLSEQLPGTVRVAFLNPQYGLLALQGPQFQAVLSACGLVPSEPLPKRFHIGEYTLAGIPVLLSRTGYTGEDGVEIVVLASSAELLWQTLLDKGQSLGLRPVGLAARDTLRLEAAYPLHGAELTEAITPLEAGLGWSVKLSKSGDFIGRPILEAQAQNGWLRHFVCIEVLQKAIPRAHDTLYDAAGAVLGEVTSGSISPTLDKPIGVGYLQGKTDLAIGTPVWVGIRGNKVEARVVARPFYRK